MKILAPLKRKFLAGLLILPLASAAWAEGTNQFRGVYLEPGKTVADYRNVALNPLDTTNREPVSFPHATSNSEYNQREFAARCAIDGNRRNDDVHGCGSWGPQKETNIWWRLDFGRPVELDKLVLFLRAAWTPADAPHDSYWQEATVEFSDGSTEKLELKQVATGQEFTFPKRTVSWLVLKNLKPAADKWCALCEFEAWGRDAAEFAYVPDAAFAAQLRQDPLVAKAMAAMMGFQRASWEQGVAGQALLEAGERDAAIALARASLIYVNQNGVVAAQGGSTTDPLMLGDCLWWSARQTGDPELVKAADNMLQFALKGAPRAADGTPFHQAASQEMWSDGSFTTPPFLAAAGKPDEAIAQLLGVHRRLWDADKKLMHHRWSEPKQTLVDPTFLGRRQRLDRRRFCPGPSLAARLTARPIANNSPRCSRNCSMAVWRISDRTDYFTTRWTIHPRSLKPTWRPCWLMPFTKACAADGCRKVICLAPTRCARRCAPRWITSDLFREWRARQTSIGRAFRRKARHFSF